MRVVELYARKRVLTKELAAAEFVRKITHKSRPVPKWVLAPEEILRAEIRRVKRALRDRATALPIAPVEPGAAARGRSPAAREGRRARQRPKRAGLARACRRRGARCSRTRSSGA